MNAYRLRSRTPTRQTRMPRGLASVAVAVPALAIVLLAAPARATVSCWSATLAAPSLVCETAVSPATGSGSFILDDVAHTLDYSITCSGLTSAETAAHIHGPAAPGTCAGPLVPLAVGCPVSGTAGTTPADESAITTGMAYINIHTMTFTGGEIRGDLVAAPCPTPTPTVTPTPPCAAAPVAGCRTPSVGEHALISHVDKEPDDAKDIFQWKWLKGSVTAKADFGAPLTSTSYILCVYDGTPAVIEDATIPAGGMCGSKPKPCWKENAKGFQYKNNLLTPDGVEQLKLKEGLTAGKAQIQVKSKGPLVDDPTFPITQPVTVQLLNSDGICWEATYSAPATKNTAGPPAQFKDKAD